MRGHSHVGVERALIPLVAAGALLVAGCGERPPVGHSGLFFPTKPREGAGMDALYSGPLAVKDDCVLIGQPGQYSLPIWREGFSAELREGRVVVLDADGATVAVEGRDFRMGGGYTAEFRPVDKTDPREEQVRRVEEWLGYSIPGRCLGPDLYGVWVVGETKALEA